MPLPSSLTEPALAEWLRTFNDETREGDYWGSLARAVRSLVEAKVREALTLDDNRSDMDVNRIVTRVMGAP